jgi:chromosome segregation ATPase
MSAYSKDESQSRPLVSGLIHGESKKTQSTNPTNNEFGNMSGVVRIDPSLVSGENTSSLRAPRILRDLELLCFTVREMELTMGKERIKTHKSEISLREAQTRINELTGSIEKFKGDIMAQQAKEESFTEQLRTQANRLAGSKADYDNLQKHYAEEKRKHALEYESLKILIQKEQKRFQSLEREYASSRQESEHQATYTNNLQNFNNSIQEKKLQNELNGQMNKIHTLEEYILQLKDELARKKSELEREHSKVLETSLELRKTLAQLKNEEAELARYKTELSRTRDKLKSTEAAVLVAKRESLDAVEKCKLLEAQEKERLKEFAEKQRTQVISGKYQENIGALDGNSNNDVEQLRQFLETKNRQIGNLKSKLGNVSTKDNEKKKLDQVLTLMVEQRDKLKDIVSELEGNHQ